MLELNAQALFRAGVGFRTLRLSLDMAQRNLSAEEREKPAREITRLDIRGVSPVLGLPALPWLSLPPQTPSRGWWKA